MIESVLDHSPVDPADVPKFPVWILENSCWRAVSRVLFVVHYYRDVSVSSTSGVEARSESLVLGHDGILVQAALAIDDPVDVPSRNDTCVFGGACEYRPVLAIPWTTQSTFTPDIRGYGCIGCPDGGIDDVDTVVVGEGSVCSFPSCDTTAAVAQKDLRRLDPGGAETVEKVGLAGDDAFVEIGVAQFTHVNLSSFVRFSSHSAAREGKAYSILVRIEPAVIEPAIGATEADRMRRSIGVVSPCIREVNIVCPEIDVAERCILWHRIPCRA